MEEASLKERLVEAALRGMKTGDFEFRVFDFGIVVDYRWIGSNGNTWVRSTSVTWTELENTTANPLITAMTSLTKQASTYQ